MSDFPRWRYWLVGGLTLLGLLFALPNVFGEDPALQIALVGREKPACTEACVKAVEGQMRTHGVPFLRTETKDNQLIVRFATHNEQLKARDVFKDLADQYSYALTSAPRTPHWMQSVGLKPMKLGLDLRGGSYLVYQVDIQGAIKQLEGSVEQELRRALREAKIQYTDITLLPDPRTGGDALKISLRNAADLDKAREIVAKA